MGAFRAARGVRSTRIGYPAAAGSGPLPPRLRLAGAPPRYADLTPPSYVRSLLVVAKSLHGAISCHHS